MVFRQRSRAKEIAAKGVDCHGVRAAQMPDKICDGIGSIGEALVHTIAGIEENKHVCTRKAAGCARKADRWFCTRASPMLPMPSQILSGIWAARTPWQSTPLAAISFARLR